MKRAERQPATLAISIYAGIYAKAYTVPDAGTLLPQHSHEFAHLTALTAGSVRVWRGSRLLGDHHAPSLIQIPAHTLHQFLTLTPNVGLMCLHNADHVDADGEPAVAEHAHLELED